MEESQIILRKNTGPSYFERGWGNGYVSLPPGHKYHGKHYTELYHLDYFGQELTYSALEGENWVVGFDTAHYGMTEENWGKDKVYRTAEKLQEVLGPLRDYYSDTLIRTNLDLE